MTIIILAFLLLSFSTVTILRQTANPDLPGAEAMSGMLEALEPYAEYIQFSLPLLALLLLIAALFNKRTGSSLEAKASELGTKTSELGEARVQIEELRQMKEALEEQYEAEKQRRGVLEADIQKADERIKELQGGKLKRDTVIDAELINLLGLLQEKGRFIDFVMGDISKYADDKIGAAARVVHQGCKELLMRYFTIAPVLEGNEGQEVTLGPDISRKEVRVIGGDIDKQDAKGRLLHRGWKAEEVRLPRLNEDAVSEGQSVISPAEIDLGKS